MENQEWLELNQLHYMNKKSIPQASKQWQARSEYSWQVAPRAYFTWTSRMVPPNSVGFSIPNDDDVDK